MALTDGTRNIWALVDIDSDFENPDYVIIHTSPGVPLYNHANTATDQELEQLRQTIASLLHNRPDEVTGIMTSLKNAILEYFAAGLDPVAGPRP